MLFFKTLLSFLRDRDYQDLLVTTMLVLGIGATIYHYIEGWSWVDSFYFSVITLTTIGYGDFSPQTDTGKVFTIFYIMVGLGIILSFINTVHNHFRLAKSRQRKKR
jgi:voltage-gated potassium channel